MVRFVVMAAGQAARMGMDKLALPWGQSTVLGHVLTCCLQALEHWDMVPESDVLRRAGIKPEIRVVARKPISRYLSEPVIAEFTQQGGTWLEVENPQPLADTIRAGILAMPQNFQGVCFIPGDQVGLVPEILADMTKCFLDSPADFLIPVAGNQPGSPVFFHRKYLAELAALQGENGGKKVALGHPEVWKTYEVEKSFLADVDTLDEYNLLLAKRALKPKKGMGA
ncbi:MAG TPA: nucleotidyltransferase family protein [Verrucomicrobiae bacterium]|nr:nucleotidyltransferase family protein [Verrucomicrobiae bacterium]